MIQDGVALSRSLKPIRNEFIQSILGDPRFDGLDGEIISGDPTADDVYRITNGNVMRATGKPDFTFWIFDNFMHPHVYRNRQRVIHLFDPTGIHPNIKVLTSVSVFNMKELQEYEQSCLGQGYEGVILRNPNGLYKHGRSTAKEGGLIKVKRFTDSET